MSMREFFRAIQGAPVFKVSKVMQSDAQPADSKFTKDLRLPLFAAALFVLAINSGIPRQALWCSVPTIEWGY